MLLNEPGEAPAVLSQVRSVAVEVAADEEDGVVAVEVAQLGDAIDLHAAGR